MGRTSQVRLEPDVVAHLDADAELDGLSTSARANRVIRARYGGAPPRPSPVPEEHDAPTADREPPQGSASSGRTLAAARHRGARATPGECRHPVGRRIGSRCAMCGAEVR
jgi:hypothetical protein